MTIELVQPEPSVQITGSPVAFADQAAAAIVAQVSIDVDLDPEVARRVEDALAANMTHWFNTVAENERGSVVRFMRSRATRVDDGSLRGSVKAAALTETADLVAPQFQRATQPATPWGPTPA